MLTDMTKSLKTKQKQQEKKGHSFSDLIMQLRKGKLVTVNIVSKMFTMSFTITAL